MSDKNDLLFEILRNGGTVMDMPFNEDGTPDGDALHSSLAKAIASIPAAWVRLKNDAEWNGKKYFSLNEVVGAMLHGIMKASGTYTKGGTGERCEDELPDDLTGLARFLKHELTAWKPLLGETIFDSSLCEVGAFVWSRIGEGKWFTESTCNAETAVHNGLIVLRDAARDFDRFNRDFDERWAKEHPEEEPETDGRG